MLTVPTPRSASTLDTSDLLALWDQCVPLPSPAARARAVVAAVGDRSASRLTVGEANVVLLQFYARLAGPVMAGVAECPTCGAELELEIDATTLAAAGGPPMTQVTVDAGGRHLVVDVPTIDDLAGGPGSGDDLLRWCVVTDEDGILDGPAAGANGVDDWRSAIGDAVAAADPMAEIALTLTCPGCAASWDETLDPAAFVWAELDAEVRRVASEVLALSRAYGWSEAAITSLTPWRRRLYLEAAGA